MAPDGHTVPGTATMSGSRGAQLRVARERVAALEQELAALVGQVTPIVRELEQIEGQIEAVRASFAGMELGVIPWYGDPGQHGRNLLRRDELRVGLVGIVSAAVHARGARS